MATQTVTITAGQSLSNSTNLGIGTVIALLTPPAWNDAKLSFQLSPDNVAFYELVDAKTADLDMMRCAPGTWVPITEVQFPKNSYLKIRSGSLSTPVVQSADRVFTIVTA